MYYGSNYIIAKIEGTVTVSKKVYDPKKMSIKLENKDIHLQKSMHEGTFSTFLWEQTSTECFQAYEDIYTGIGLMYEPYTATQSKKVMVNQPTKGITFALDLTSTTILCGTEVYKTQIESIYIVLHVHNFIKEIQPSHTVDRLDNVIGRVNL